MGKKSLLARPSTFYSDSGKEELQGILDEIGNDSQMTSNAEDGFRREMHKSEKAVTEELMHNTAQKGLDETENEACTELKDDSPENYPTCAFSSRMQPEDLTMENIEQEVEDA